MEFKMKRLSILSLLFMPSFLWASNFDKEKLDSICPNGNFSPLQGCICSQPDQVFGYINGQYQCTVKSILPSADVNTCTDNTCTVYGDTEVLPQLLYVGASVQLGKLSQSQTEQFLSQYGNNYFNVSYPTPGFNSFQSAVYNFRTDISSLNSDSMDLSVIQGSMGIMPTLLKQHTNNNPANAFYQYTTDYYISGDSSYLASFIGLDPDFAQKRQQFINYEMATIKHSDIIISALNYFYENLPNFNSSPSWLYENERGENCAQACNLKHVTEDYNDTGIQLTITQRVIDGQHAQRFLRLKNTNENGDNLLGSDILIQLTPTLYPSLIQYRDRFKESENVYDQYAYYSFSQGLVTEQRIDIINEDSSEFLDHLRQPLNSDHPTVFLCEGILANHEDPQSLIELKGNLITGPNPASYFGWRAYDEPLNYFNDIFPHHFSMQESKTEFSNSHLVGTTKSALKVDNNTQVLPLGFYQCIEDFEQWSSLIDASNSKSIAFSQEIFSHIDDQSCEDMLISNIDSINGKKLLWSFAAGNDAEENPQQNSCLQKLSLLPNVLIVGAFNESNPSELASYSNFGRQLVDITTSGHIDGSDGTSFASPRIAALAAKIGHEFPELSAGELKKAILISSEYDESLKEKVKSSAYITTDSTTVDFERISKELTCLSREDRTSNEFMHCMGFTACVEYRYVFFEGWKTFEADIKKCHNNKRNHYYEYQTPNKYEHLFNTHQL